MQETDADSLARVRPYSARLRDAGKDGCPNAQNFETCLRERRNEFGARHTGRSAHAAIVTR
jgi:hypothetical protein